MTQAARPPLWMKAAVIAITLVVIALLAVLSGAGSNSRWPVMLAATALALGSGAVMTVTNKLYSKFAERSK